MDQVRRKMYQVGEARAYCLITPLICHDIHRSLTHDDLQAAMLQDSPDQPGSHSHLVAFASDWRPGWPPFTQIPCELQSAEDSQFLGVEQFIAASHPSSHSHLSLS